MSKQKWEKNFVSIALIITITSTEINRFNYSEHGVNYLKYYI